MSIAKIASIALIIGLVSFERANADTPDSECQEFSVFLRHAPFQLKSITIYGKEKEIIDFSDQDFSYVASALSNCRDRIKRVPADTISFFQQYRRYYDSEKSMLEESRKAVRLDAARRELDGLMGHILNDKEVARVKEIGAANPTLTDIADLTIDRNKKNIAAEAAKEEMRRRDEAIEQKQTKDQAAFVAGLPISCKNVDAMKHDSERTVQRGAQASMLAQAGETKRACNIFEDVSSRLEEIRSKTIECYKELTERKDTVAQNAASVALYEAAQLHQGQLQFHQAAQQLGCN